MLLVYLTLYCTKCNMSRYLKWVWHPSFSPSQALNHISAAWLALHQTLSGDEPHAMLGWAPGQLLLQLYQVRPTGWRFHGQTQDLLERLYSISHSWLGNIWGCVSGNWENSGSDLLSLSSLSPPSWKVEGKRMEKKPITGEKPQSSITPLSLTNN